MTTVDAECRQAFEEYFEPKGWNLKKGKNLYGDDFYEDRETEVLFIGFCTAWTRSNAVSHKAEIDCWRKLANAKPRVIWQRGFPTEGGMYLVRLTDGEMCVTPWNDGSGKNTDSWGDKRQTGWCCLTDSQSTVVGWIKATDLKTLPVAPLAPPPPTGDQSGRKP